MTRDQMRLVAKDVLIFAVGTHRGVNGAALAQIPFYLLAYLLA